MSDFVLRTSCIVIFTTTQLWDDYYFPHYTHVKTEAQRDQATYYLPNVTKLIKWKNWILSAHHHSHWPFKSQTSRGDA